MDKAMHNNFLLCIAYFLAYFLRRFPQFYTLEILFQVLISTLYS